MKKNMGRNDKSIRIPLGILIAMAGIYFQSWWGLVGLVFIITGITGFCPFYKIFNISTRKKEPAKKVVM